MVDYPPQPERKPAWRIAPSWAVALNQDEQHRWFWSDLIDLKTYRESRPKLALG